MGSKFSQTTSDEELDGEGKRTLELRMQGQFKAAPGGTGFLGSPQSREL